MVYDNIAGATLFSIFRNINSKSWTIALGINKHSANFLEIHQEF